MRIFAAVLILLVAGCTIGVQPAHRQALKTMQPIITAPLFELLMRSEIPHHKPQEPGTASDLGSALMSVKGVSIRTK